MADENAKLVQDAYEAFGRGDIPTVLEAFDENVAWHVPDVVPHGRTVTGREEVAGFFQNLAATWDDFGVEVDDVTMSGDRAYARGRANGTYRGERTGYGFVHAWTLSDGVCVRFDEYVDPAPELVAAAASTGVGAR